MTENTTNANEFPLVTSLNDDDEFIIIRQDAGARATAEKLVLAVNRLGALSANVYATIEEGRAAVADGETFLVEAANDGIADLHRRTDANNSVLIGIHASQTDLQNALDEIEGVASTVTALEDAFFVNSVFGEDIVGTQWVNFGGYRKGFDAGTDIPVGTNFSQFEAELLTRSNVAEYRFFIYERSTQSTNINSAPPLSEDILLWSDIKTPAELGLTVGASVHEPMAIEFPAIEVESGKSYFVWIQARDTANIELQTGFGIGNAPSSDARQRQRGWFNSGATGVPNGFTVAFRLVGRQFSGGSSDPSGSTLSYDDRINSATFSRNGLTLTSDIVFSRNGVSTNYSSENSFTAPPSGQFRYDVLVFDRETLSFSIIAGTNAATDAAERIASLSTSTQINVAHIRVSSTNIEVIERWDIYENIPRQYVEQYRQDDQRNKAMIAKFRAKLASGASLSIGAVGDSIVAQQSGGASEVVPNGASRDSAAANGTTFTYFRDNISDDIVDALPLYTSSQLGRDDDGAGQIHTRTSFVWEMIDELERLGRTLGTDLFYDNFCSAGRTSTQFRGANGVNSAWFNNALALNWDLAVVNFGMNADANVALTRSNMIAIGEQFKAAGTDVIFMGRAIRRTGSDQATFEQVNRAIREAAEFVGAAFIPMLPNYSEGQLALGISRSDSCNANANNHPGIVEHREAGNPLRRAVRL